MNSSDARDVLEPTGTCAHSLECDHSLDSACAPLRDVCACARRGGEEGKAEEEGEDLVVSSDNRIEHVFRLKLPPTTTLPLLTQESP